MFLFTLVLLGVRFGDSRPKCFLFTPRSPNRETLNTEQFKARTSPSPPKGMISLRILKVLGPQNPKFSGALRAPEMLDLSYASNVF